MTLETVEQKASYGIGLQIGQQLKESEIDKLDLNSLKQGLEDVLTDNQPAVALEELHDALRQMHEKSMQKKQQRVEETMQQGKCFLQENLAKEGIQLTESGLQYLIVKQGTGAIPTELDRVRVHYTGRLIDNTVFDSSVQRGQPAEFPVNGVIAGWKEALQLMPVGSVWHLFIPQELAYGEHGAGQAIAPYSALIFEVELIDII